MAHGVRQLYETRSSRKWPDRLRRWLTPPLPLVMNPNEPIDFPMGKTPHFINVDLFLLPGVDVAADAHHLPFADGAFTRIATPSLST